MIIAFCKKKNLLSVQTLFINMIKYINEKIANVKKDFENQLPYLDNVRILLAEQGKNNPIFVYADKVRVYEVIANLLGNAIKFTQKGTITISADMRPNTSSKSAGSHY